MSYALVCIGCIEAHKYSANTSELWNYIQEKCSTGIFLTNIIGMGLIRSSLQRSGVLIDSSAPLSSGGAPNHSAVDATVRIEIKNFQSNDGWKISETECAAIAASLNKDSEIQSADLIKFTLFVEHCARHCGFRVH